MASSLLAAMATSAGALEVPLSTVAIRPEQVTAVGSGAVFVSRGPDGRNKLWGTDGTPSGTRELVDPCPLPCDGTAPIRVVGATSTGLAFFSAKDPATSLDFSNLWRTDGTPGGTYSILNASQVGGVDLFGQQSHAIAGSKLLFRNSSLGQFLWVSDGSVAGTGPLEGLPPSHFGDQVDICQGDLNAAYFRLSILGEGYRFYRTDGTPAGTSAPISIGDLSVSCLRSVVADGRFWAPTWQVDAPLLGLWTTNGSTSGTTFSGALPGNPFPIEVRDGRALLIVRDDQGGAPGLWVSDGTPGGTRLLKQGTRWASFNYYYTVQMFEVIGPFAYYLYVNDDDALEVRRVRLDGADDQLIQTICPANCQFAAQFSWIESVGADLVFPSQTPTTGLQLFRLESGDSIASRVEVPCSSLCEYRLDYHQKLASRLLFDYWDDSNGLDLWEIGPAEGTPHQLSNFAAHGPFVLDSTSSPFVLAGGRLLVPAIEQDSEVALLYSLPAFDSCNSGSARLCLRDDRFRLEAHWLNFQGHEGTGHATPLTTDTGYFWFFDDANVELMVKVIDGTGFNGHYWVFYGALSNVEYWITVEDTVTGASKQYHNELGQFGSFGDIEALPAGAPAGPAAAQPQATEMRVPPLFDAIDEGSSGTCSPSATRLCVLDGRFAVEATWTDFAGDSGAANAQSLTSDTGYFWFFNEANVELVTKVIDGSAFNAHFWAYYGALSNVEYTLTVTDTVAGGPARIYHNALGQFGSFGDIEAFPAP